MRWWFLVKRSLIVRLRHRFGYNLGIDAQGYLGYGSGMRNLYPPSLPYPNHGNGWVYRLSYVLYYNR